MAARPRCHPVGRFLSTLSLRRATLLAACVRACLLDFYPRSPCGERPRATTSAASFGVISIHALLAESDRTNKLAFNLISPFLSTLSLRRATHSTSAVATGRNYFYPRSPCGERREYWVGGYGTANNFYPRSPCGERQQQQITAETNLTISIHALLAESDPGPRRGRVPLSHFYPRSPCGERQAGPVRNSRQKYFYPRSPCGERPVQHPGIQKLFDISIHALLAESDQRYHAAPQRQ